MPPEGEESSQEEPKSAQEDGDGETGNKLMYSVCQLAIEMLISLTRRIEACQRNG